MYLQGAEVVYLGEFRNCLPIGVSIDGIVFGLPLLLKIGMLADLIVWARL